MHYDNYMKECIELALQGAGNVSPNPLAGCVVLDKYGDKISTGYHEKYGGNHAERNALLDCNAKDGTLIVNLEPCSHHGKTPPCTDLIIEKGIQRVVIGMRDPNPLVNGVQKLTDAGIEVIEGVLEDECRKLNEVFIKNKTQGKTFAAIKTASTLDGKIATACGSSKWITSEKARAEVKNIRKRYDAIMTTSATILADNPAMEHKTKIILDRRLKTDLNARIYKQGKIYVFHEAVPPPSAAENIEFIKISGLELVFGKLYELGIMSVLIEAGGRFNGEALSYTDKIYHFIAPKVTGDNSAKSCFDYRKITDINESLNFKIDKAEFFGPDLLMTIRRG
ncbi:MAG: bifunctional diaminohydroxyphosphoribosylaminopyrimidine deaminase/5-amino-6-(5-phosphoribosylamino)uracil reductase RibD [Heliobacteriaceae bacterium]|jgi:diaminohydroxyphosphoribosylaminopyrimidine deaminase/5-amino-6-(5-phosphoribosylamino)uracil reductase|nr:bifunctional diaminohydroxyphosphoribosylaminopyrimidine deaminase/5-amino-6-(5-phosphoribosylamino)uracil reductase RibD [Heliobacteriaceae bacterium]